MNSFWMVAIVFLFVIVSPVFTGLDYRDWCKPTRSNHRRGEPFSLPERRRNDRVLRQAVRRR